MVNYYKILGLENYADAELIKRAYKDKIREFHPDINSSEDAPHQHPRRMAVGFSLLGDTRNMVEKDMMVTRFLAKLARSRKMRTRQVLDEPELYGIDPNIPKTLGNTLTSWILIESEAYE